MLNINLLIEFTAEQLRSYKRAPASLEAAYVDENIINFLNRNNIKFDAPIDGLKIACVLGLIKNCLNLDIHVLGEKTIASAIGMVNLNSNIGFGRYERWLKSETLNDFYENTLPILKTIKLHNLKINALTIVNDIVMKQEQLDGEDFNKEPFDRFAVRQAVQFNQEFTDKTTPEMIIEARKIAGLTQKQSAKLVCVDERTWQRWESGDRNMARGLFKLYLIETKQF